MLENITVNGTEYVPKELTDSKIQFLENKYRIAMAINVTDESKLRSEIAELKKKNKEFNLQNLPFMSLADIARCHEELSDYYIKRVDNAKRVSESIKNRESFATGIGATIGKPCEELKELIKESIFGFKPLFTPMEIALMAEALRRENPAPSNPPYSRREVLSEKWKPTTRANQITSNPCFLIADNGRVVNVNNAFGFDEAAWEENVFSPTSELAEEVISIRKGEWLPKKGDVVCCINRTDSKVYDDDIFTMYGDVTKGDSCNRNMIYFPTHEQRTAFIEKNKPKEYISKGIGSVTFTGGNSYGGVEITVTVKDK